MAYGYISILPFREMYFVFVRGNLWNNWMYYKNSLQIENFVSVIGYVYSSKIQLYIYFVIANGF